MTVRQQRAGFEVSGANLSDGFVDRSIASGSKIRSWLPLLAIFLLVVASRVPFSSAILYHWDSVNIALGMDDFDVARQQPQPPGYILYIALARLIDGLVGDPQTTLVLISIVFSGLAAMAIFVLARALLPAQGDRAAWLSALFLATSPLIWFYGEIALPHSVDLFFVTLVALVAWRVRSGAHELLIWLAVLLAVTGGVRQQTLVFMLPLLVWCLWRVPPRKLIVPGLLFTLLTLAWLVPLMLSAGGVNAYLALTDTYSRIFFDPTSIFGRGGVAGLWRNSGKLALYTLYGVGFAALPLAAWAIWRVLGRPGAKRVAAASRPVTLSSAMGTPEPDVNVRSQSATADLALRPAVSLLERLLPSAGARLKAEPPRSVVLADVARSTWGGLLAADRAIFLALWIVPAAAFYSLIHMGQPGLVLSFLPALLLAASAALLQMAGRLPRLGIRHALLGGAAIVALNSFVFLVVPEFPMGAGYNRVLSRDTLANHDGWFKAHISAISANYPPAESLLLARDSRILSYYLPSYSIVRAPAPPFDTDPLLEPADYSIHTLDRSATGLGSSGDWWVLLPDDHWRHIYSDFAVEKRDLAQGHLTALRVPAGGRIEFNGVMIKVVAAP